MDIGFLGYVRIFKRSLICLDDSFNEETVLGLKKKNQSKGFWNPRDYVEKMAVLLSLWMKKG